MAKHYGCRNGGCDALSDVVAYYVPSGAGEAFITLRLISSSVKWARSVSVEAVLGAMIRIGIL